MKYLFFNFMAALKARGARMYSHRLFSLLKINNTLIIISGVVEYSLPDLIQFLLGDSIVLLASC